MSGILLPGQDREPKPEGKIELPKGARAPKPERERERPPAEPAKPEAAETPAHQPGRQPARHGQGGQGMDIAFPPQAAQVRCPSCGASYVVPVFSVIDLGANPELRGPLLGGQINVAMCQSCGAGGQLSAPLMVHDPENQFLGVYMPLEGMGEEMQRQKVIGDLTQMVMRKIPSESRKGYMLQPRQFVDWDKLMEQLWGFEGVTPEMLRKQRDQTALLQRLLTVVDDPGALDILLKRSADLIDREFFTLLDQVLLMSRGQGQGGGLEPLRKLRERLLDTTEAGQAVKKQQEKVRAMLARLQESTTHDQVLDIVLEAWRGKWAAGDGDAGDCDRHPHRLPGAFLMALSQRIDAAVTRKIAFDMMALRSFLLEIQEQAGSAAASASRDGGRGAGCAARGASSTIRRRYCVNMPMPPTRSPFAGEAVTVCCGWKALLLVARRLSTGGGAAIETLKNGAADMVTA